MLSPHEKTRLLATYRTSGGLYVNGRSAVRHYLLPVNATLDGGTSTLADCKTLCVATSASSASSVSLGVVGSCRQPSSTSSLLRRLHRMAASEGNEEPDPYIPFPPPPASTSMPSRPQRPRSMPPRPVLERQPTTTSTATMNGGVSDSRLMMNSRQPSCPSMTAGSSTLDALGLRRSAILSYCFTS